MNFAPKFCRSLISYCFIAVYPYFSPSLLCTFELCARMMDDAYRERARLRGELEKMLAEDVSEYGRSRLRRYEQELQQTADWFTATDDYYRLVKENYMACYDHLTGLAETLRAALGAEE